jgi:hypothetical protein
MALYLCQQTISADKKTMKNEKVVKKSMTRMLGNKTYAKKAVSAGFAS